jgi:ataxia telangiectasia mutated family protein
VLRVLRLNLSQLLTILEVVIHDPLYKWSLSPLQAQTRRQLQQQGEGQDAFQQAHFQQAQQQHTAGGAGGSSSQDAAQRALLRIQNKLLG